MITAHLPAGYVLYRLLPRGYQNAPWILPAALLGAILPDLDLIWFYFIDERAVHHHRYWVHIPGFWLAIAAINLPLIKVVWPRFMPAALAFFAALLVHICLDSVVGDVLWLWPFSTEMFALFTVPASHDSWILSFLTHWSILFEVAIWIAAAALFWTRP